MISSIDPTKTGTTLLPQTETPVVTKTTTVGTTTNSQSSLLPQSSPSSSGSLTETLNNLITMLQGLMASISALLGGGTSGGVKTPTTPGNSGQYDFLRPVDEEPVTVIPPSKKGAGPSNAGQVILDSDVSAPVETPKKPTKTKTKGKTGGTTLKGSNGQFLWKPQSEKDGKLAILLPKGLTGKVKGVEILSPDLGTVLGKGKFSGVGNEDREHYRFNKSGGGYPDGAVVVITMADGSKQQVTIKETSSRTTR